MDDTTSAEYAALESATFSLTDGLNEIRFSLREFNRVSEVCVMNNNQGLLRVSERAVRELTAIEILVSNLRVRLLEETES